MASDHGVGRCAPQTDQAATVHGVREAAERGLGGDVGPLHRVASKQQLRHRVVDQARRIVAILVAGGDQEHPLAQQIDQIVGHPTRIARVAHDPG